MREGEDKKRIDFSDAVSVANFYAGGEETVCSLRQQVAALKAELESVRRQLDIAKKFYDVVVKERDYERAMVQRLQAELDLACR